MKSPRLILTQILVVMALGIASCGDASIESSSTTVPVPTSSSLGTPGLLTNGWVQVGDRSFDLEFVCYSAGAGDVVAVGVGKHPESGQRIDALVQGFLGQPYVGLTIGESVRYEASLESPLQIFLHDGTISAGAIEWVRGLDLDSGTAERIGYGAVFVSCGEYVLGLPQGY